MDSNGGAACRVQNRTREQVCSYRAVRFCNCYRAYIHPQQMGGAAGMGYAGSDTLVGSFAAKLPCAQNQAAMAIGMFGYRAGR